MCVCNCVQVEDLPAIVLSPAQYYNYTQPRGNFIPTSLAAAAAADDAAAADRSATVSWWSRDAGARRLLGTFRLASGVAATCVLRSPFNSSFDAAAPRLRAMNYSGADSPAAHLLQRYFEPGCESVFVRGLPMTNFVPPAAVIVDDAAAAANQSASPDSAGKSRDSTEVYIHGLEAWHSLWSEVQTCIWPS